MIAFGAMRKRLVVPGLLLVPLLMPAAPCHAQGRLKVEIVPITQHSMVQAVAFSPDGARVLSGGFDNSVKLWDVATGRLLRTFRGHTSAVRSITFSRNGAIALSGGYGGTIKLWDIKTGQLLRTFADDAGAINSVAFSPDELRIVSGSRTMLGDGNRIRIWNAATGELQRVISANTGEVESVRFSSDGTRILSGSTASPWVSGDRHAVREWDARTGKLLRTLVGHKEAVNAVVYSPDESKLLSGSWDKTIKVWDATSGQLLQTLTGHTQRVYSVTFSPDGNLIVSGGLDDLVKLWDARTGKLLRNLEGHRGPVNSVAFSPDGKQVISGSDDNTLKLWNVETGKLVRTFGGQATSVATVAFSPDGRRIVSGSDAPGTTVKVWDLASGHLTDVLAVHGASAASVGFSRDGSEILAGNSTGGVKVWRSIDGTSLRSFGFGSVGAHFAFAGDGKSAFSGLSDGTVRMVDATEGKPLRIMRHLQKMPAWCAPKCNKSVSAVALSPDGTRMASAGEEESIKLWDTQTGQLLRTIQLKRGWSKSLQFSPDGMSLLSGDLYDGTRLYNSATGQLIRLYESDTVVSSSVFSPDGGMVLSGSDDGLAKLWETTTGKLLRVLTGHAGGITSVAFSPDGRRIITASNDTTVRVWNTQTGQLLVTIVGSKDGEWLMITPEGFFSGSANSGELLTIVRGLEGFSVDQFYQSLYRPDLVREKLAGDPRGQVRLAAVSLDLTKVADSGNAPLVRVVSPVDGTNAANSQLTATIQLTAREGGLGRIEWRVNGVTAGIDTPASAPAPGQSLSLNRNLALDAGSNTIEVVAYNRANLIASMPARVAVTTAPASAATAMRDSRLFVLAAGLDNYADKRFRLAYSVADAKLMAKALADSGNGFYRSVDVSVMSDGEVNAAKLDAAFADLARKIGPYDVFVLYLAGHGKTVDGRYYFIPHNFGFDGDLAGAQVNAAVKAQGISQEQWQRWFAQIPARKSLILFDTCESGTLAGERSETKLLEQGAANDRLARATGRSIITAASGNAEAFEGYRGHGLFTYNLLDALDRGDGDGNGTIEVTELAAYVHAQVIAISERVFKQRQEPQMRINLNYPLTRQARVLDNEAPAVAGSTAPNYQLTQTAQLQTRPDSGATAVRSLSAKTAVTVIRQEGGWSLIASNGRPLGYVATRDLAPIR